MPPSPHLNRPSPLLCPQPRSLGAQHLQHTTYSAATVLLVLMAKAAVLSDPPGKSILPLMSLPWPSAPPNLPPSSLRAQSHSLSSTDCQFTADCRADPRNPHRRRPFSTWVKKLANFKSSSDGDRPRRHVKNKHGKNNNPYPESGVVADRNHHEESAASFTTAQSGSNGSLEHSASHAAEHTGRQGRSVAGTFSTEHEGSMAPDSHGTSSVAGTSRTMGGGIDSRRGDSTFSSPAPSVRSLTTTLTTIQSMAPHGHNSSTSPAANNPQSVQFSQPFPTTSPASAIPAHLTPNGVPNTYTAATANGLLTDNASILTLASSSKRRRRRSMDTDASVRALAPSSVWGGSRESLPLSVLSANIDSGMPNTPGLHTTTSRMGADRNSIYSSTGVPPALPGDRNSYYAKQADAVSIRSGRPGHSRTESVGTSVANAAALHSPLAGPQATEKFDKAEKVDGAGSTKEE